MFVYGYDASLNVKNSFPVFSTHIEANYISKREVFGLVSMCMRFGVDGGMEEVPDEVVV